MSIRADALRWLSSRRVPAGHIVTSRRYAPDESWTKEKAWWIQVPWAAVRAGKLLHIVCEAEPGSRTFRHLQVPAKFLLEHALDFATIAPDNINLFLAAEEGMEFQNQRGSGRISFAQFEQR